jgi:integrase/recombinase XerD
MTEATAAVSPLHRRMIDDMSLRNLSSATQRSYLHAVTQFSRYFGRSPDCLGLADVRAFQIHLVSLGITLDWGEIPERIVYARMPRKLSAILSADEVKRFLEAVPSLKARAALTKAYATGLRASEVASLRVADIDSDRNAEPGLKCALFGRARKGGDCSRLTSANRNRSCAYTK